MATDAVNKIKLGEVKIMKMKKFINNPENLTPELLEGFAEAHKELVTLGENRMIINNKLAEADRVTIVTQGGSGHEPAISGFVGREWWISPWWEMFSRLPDLRPAWMP